MAVRSRWNRWTEKQIRLQDIVHPKHYGFTKTSHHDADGRKDGDRSGERPNQDGCPPQRSRQAPGGKQRLYSEDPADEAGGDSRQTGNQQRES